MLERGAWGRRVVCVSLGFLSACQFQSEVHFETSPRATTPPAKKVGTSTERVIDVYARVTDTCLLFDNGTQHCFGNIDNGENDYFPGVADRIDCERRKNTSSGCHLPDVNAPGESWSKLRDEQQLQERSKKQTRIIRDAFPTTKLSDTVTITPSKAPHSAVFPVHHCALLDGGRVDCVEQETLRRKLFVPNGALRLFGGQRLCAQLHDKSVVCAPFWLDDLTPAHHFPAIEHISEWQSGRQLACARHKQGVTCVSFENKMKEDPVFGWVPAIDKMGKLWQPFAGRTEKFSVGDSHACIVDDQAQVYCWGSRRTGQIGDDAPRPFVNEPQTIESIHDAKQLVAGAHHSCALERERVLCWGDNSKGQLSRDPAKLDFSAQPLEIALDTPTESISGGTFHSCALSKNGTVSCWGAAKKSNEPLRTVSLSGKIEKVVSHGERNCSLNSAGRVTCWKNDDDDHQKQFAALPVSALLGSTELSLSPTHVCGLVQGKVLCVAFTKGHGQNALGVNATPELVAELPAMKSLSGLCGISTENQAWCWGWVRQEPQKRGGAVLLKAFRVKEISESAELWSETERRFCASSLTAAEKPVECAFTYIHDGPPGSINEHTPFDGDTLRWDGNGISRLDPELNPLRAIAWGAQHQCIVSRNGKVQCWGKIARGESGATPTAHFSEAALKVDLEQALSRFGCASRKDPMN